IALKVPDGRPYRAEGSAAGALHRLDPIARHRVESSGVSEEQDFPRRTGGQPMHRSAKGVAWPGAQLDAVVAKQASARGNPDEAASVLPDRGDFGEGEAALQVELSLQPLQSEGVRCNPCGQEPQSRERYPNAVLAKPAANRVDLRVLHTCL